MEIIEGIGVGTEFISGIVQIIEEPTTNNLEKFKEGNILVAPKITPSFISH